jgi:two-component system sensor histidine kinase YesM
MISGVICVLVPILAFLIFNNIYAINVIHNQVAESNKNMLLLYMGQLDKNLDVVDDYLNTMMASDVDYQAMMYDSEENSRQLSKILVSSKISKDVMAYKSIDGIFAYNRNGGDFVYSYNERGSIERSGIISEYIIKTLNSGRELDNKKLSSWFVTKIESQYYLLRVIKNDFAYIGAWVSLKNLVMPLNLINLGDNGASFLIDENGVPMAASKNIKMNNINLNGNFKDYYMTGDKNSFLVVGDRSSKGNFSMVALIPDSKILEKLPQLQRIINFIVFALILLIPASLLLLRKILLVPINYILDAMKKIRNGDMEARIVLKPTSEEFMIVNETFNNMVDQIHDLKISVYEEQLSKQKAEFEYLQLQVNPHFFLNSLNVIYRMSQAGKVDLIQEMTLCLIKYFRYMFRNDSRFVPLKDELEHVLNYMRIQEMRLPGSFNYLLDIPEFLLNTPVPPLIIQNFAENTVKYALTLDYKVNFTVNAEYVEIMSKPYVKIIIKDTGKGYPEEILDRLRAGEKIYDENGEHIGIWNVRNRLKHLYSGVASIEFSNAEPSGAVIEITIPRENEILLP